MSYYKEKSRAFELVDRMFAAGKTDDEIELAVGTQFGFGKKMVDERITLLVKTAKSEKKK